MPRARGRKNRIAEKNLCRFCELPLVAPRPGKKVEICACQRFQNCVSTPLVSKADSEPPAKLPYVAPRSKEQLQKRESAVFGFVADLAILASNGDHMAYESLLRIAEAASQQLTLAPAKLALKYSQAKSCWPVVADMKGTHLVSIKNLRLGSNLPAVKKTESSEHAASLLAWLIVNQLPLELPNLTTSTRTHWFEIGWNAILAATDGQPERDSILRKFGESASHKQKYSELHPESDRSQIRGRIKGTLRKAFLKLCGYNTQNPL
jgi:hypothetical protein